jgi:integrase
MVRPRKPITDPILKEWLSEFSNRNTKRQYCSAMRLFKKNLGIEDLGEYLKTEPDTATDIRKFISSLNEKPKKSLLTYTTIVKVFFQDNGVKVDDLKWKKLRRRGFIPKHPRAETRDKKPTIEQLKKILNYMDVKGRAMVLFLLSSGARIGETLQLKTDDFNLDSDPPKVFIHAEYTKGGVGQRTVYFSYEARDAIRDWIKIKDKTGKRDGSTHEDERVFSWGLFTARDMWNRAVAKAGIDKKDPRTGRRIYHLHSLRKFFRTKIGLDLDITHALMGHVEYLDEAYLRQDQDRIAQAYLESMSNVSVYSIENTELKQETQNLREELNTVKQKEQQKDERIKQLESQLEYFKSKEYTNNLVASVARTLKADDFDIVYKPKKTKSISVTIPIDSGKEPKQFLW